MFLFQVERSANQLTVFLKIKLPTHHYITNLSAAETDQDVEIKKFAVSKKGQWAFGSKRSEVV